jgi:levanase/fructan beta-fructosidase
MTYIAFLAYICSKIQITVKMNSKMKRTVNLFVATMLMTLSANAQVTPMVLSENHAMVRLDANSKYVLLPVEEKAENANVRVIGKDNECVRRPNVRLAVDHADYYVPLEIRDGQVLDIVFHGDRRTKGAVKEFACWKEMKFSNTFDTANREKFRPAYHHTPVYGWMNDPNGMFYKDGEWHLFYQYNPYGSLWENMTWGHSVSKDLIHWEALPNAIEPDAIGTIFSGSCVVDKNNTAGFGENAIIAYYTSAAEAQTQSMAYSTDGGRTFTKYEKNPVITCNIPDFRDPNFFWYEPTQRWIMLLAAGQEMQIYSSPNLKDWTMESSFGREYGNHDGVWECPDMVQLNVRGKGQQKWMLVCNINPGGPFGGNATQYFIGQFDGHKFTCESKPEVTKWMDYGKDHYATVSFSNAPEDRTVVLAWMSNWQYANQVPTKQLRSANSIPRDLDLFVDGDETYCGVTPSKEMLALRGNKVKKLTDACELIVDVKGTMELILSNDKGEQVVMNYNAQKQTFSMDRTKSGDVSFSEAFPVTTVAPTHGAVKQLRIFIDHSSIEVFEAEGKMAMTNLVFPSEPYNNIKVKGNAKFTVYSLQ